MAQEMKEASRRKSGKNYVSDLTFSCMRRGDKKFKRLTREILRYLNAFLPVRATRFAIDRMIDFILLEVPIQ